MSEAVDMTFKSLHTYRCADGRTAKIVSPITKVAGREECIVQYAFYDHIAVIDNDHSARIFDLDNEGDVNVMTDEEVLFPFSMCVEL